jgi:hypothetical protein
MQRNRKLILCAGTLLTLAATSSAIAGTTYAPTVLGMAGSQCQPSNGSQWADFSINPDGLRNNSDQNRYISCTLLPNTLTGVDQADGDNTTPAGQFIVYFSFDYSQVPTASLSYQTICTLFTKNIVSGAAASESINVSSIRTTTPVVTSAQPASFNGTDPNHYGNFSFNCRLPPGVKLWGTLQVDYGNQGGTVYVP